MSLLRRCWLLSTIRIFKRPNPWLFSLLSCVVCLGFLEITFSTPTSASPNSNASANTALEFFTFGDLETTFPKALQSLEERLPATLQPELQQLAKSSLFASLQKKGNSPLTRGELRTFIRAIYEVIRFSDIAVPYPWEGLDLSDPRYFEDPSPATKQEAVELFRFDAAPAPPQKVWAYSGNQSAILKWEEVKGASFYQVWRSSDPLTPLVKIEGVMVFGDHFEDFGLRNGKTYFYAVTAGNVLSESRFSDEVTCTPEAVLISIPTPGASRKIASARAQASAAAPPLGVPLAMGTLSATPGNGSVKLSWSSLAGATAYTVRRSTSSGGGYADFSGNSTPSTELTVTGLTNGTTYYFTAFASNATGAGPLSPEVSARPIAPPGAPSGVTATASNALVTLRWNAVPNATSYRVLRSTTRGGGYADFPGNSTSALSLVDSGLTNGTPYYYVIAAANASGQGVNSVEVSATPLPPPAPPTGVVSTPGNTSVTLRWTASPGATSYKVLRSLTPGGPYAEFPSNTTSATSLSVLGLTNGLPYYFVVTATNAGGTSPVSAEASGMPWGVLPTPTGLVAAPGNAVATLSWNAVAGATSYRIRRSTTSGTGFADFPGNVTSAVALTDTGLSNNTTYFYTVQALSASASSPFSAQTSVRPIPPPSSPLGLTVSLSGSSAVVRWSPVAGATAYRVLRSGTRGGPYSDFTGNVLTSTSLTVTGLATGSPYYFVVTASNAGGLSPLSTEVGALPVAGSVTATSGNARVTLRWNPVPDATSYRVLRSTTSGSGYSDFPNNLTTALTLTDASVSNGTVYYYVVQATNPTASSANSAQVVGRPVAPPTAPSGLTANAGVGSTRLRWTAVPGAASYIVYRSTQPNTGFAVFSGNTTTATLLNVAGLTNGTPYYFRVMASNAGGDSPLSSTVSAVPGASEAMVDADGDGVPDLWEVRRGSNPRGATSLPAFDALVDASLPASNPASKQFRTFQEAYDSLPLNSDYYAVVQVKRGLYESGLQMPTTPGSVLKKVAWVGELGASRATGLEGVQLSSLANWSLTSDTWIYGFVWEGKGDSVSAAAVSAQSVPAATSLPRVWMRNCIVRNWRMPWMGPPAVLNAGAEVELQHCTLSDCSSWEWGIDDYQSSAPILHQSGSLRILNSIVWDRDALSTAKGVSGDLAGLSIQTSIVQGSPKGGTHLDPKLTKGGWLTSSSSACFGKGSAGMAEFDIHRETRPAAAPDLGADQWLNTQAASGSLLPDWWKLWWFGTLQVNQTGDSNGDGRSELLEFAEATSPVVDQDGDGLPDWWEVYHFGNIGSQGALDDPDNDLRNNLVEFQQDTWPLYPETDYDGDSDGLPDWWEIRYFGSITAQNGEGDPDLDGRTNWEEYALDGTNPTQSDDTDRDGLPDWWEIRVFGSITAQTGNGDADRDGRSNRLEFLEGTDPLSTDYDYDGDQDGLPDYWEIQFFGSATAQNGSGDPDKDGIPNFEEYSWGSDPTETDQTYDGDGDGLPDYWEIRYFGSVAAHNAVSDPDKDGRNNLREFQEGTDPSQSQDFDGDGLDDALEIRLFGTLAETKLTDFDGDGLSNGLEMDTLRTNPASAMTAYGIHDAIAWRLGVFTTAAGWNLDSDLDGLSLLQELLRGTNPFAADSDGDGVLDGQDKAPLDSLVGATAPTGVPGAPILELFSPPGARPLP